MIDIVIVSMMNEKVAKNGRKRAKTRAVMIIMFFL
jgi:hypothetical protein